MAAYTDSLLIPTAFSLLVWILGKIFGSIGAYALLILSIFNVIWITICLELWKRRSSTLAFEWGTFEMEEIEESRYQFYGTEMERDRVSGNLVRTYPAWKRYVKVFNTTAVLS
jgi:anoctamin-10